MFAVGDTTGALHILQVPRVAHSLTYSLTHLLVDAGPYKFLGMQRVVCQRSRFCPL